MTSVSIVVPVGRVDPALAAQLSALANSHRVRQVELVLAANVELEPVAEAAGRQEWPDDWDVRVVDARGRRGPSHARNAGWRASRGEVVLFCDADDIVDPGWAAAMAAATLQHGLAGGRLRYDALNPPALARRFTPSATELPVKFRHHPYSPSCTLGVTRELLETIGGFDESLQCGEDIDLCWRARRAGGRIAFVPDAVVQYRLRDSARATFRQAFRYAADDAVLLRRHRGVGARWTLVDSSREFGAALKAVALLWAGREARITAAARVGAACGRLVGSIRHGVLAV